ncbi:MAG: putative transport system permease protein [Actinomycetota bacterium]|nr:putative transport system permease protein [Actinomycetota bacterium]
MLRITLKGVRGHLLRFVLTAVAVSLGVSLVAGTYVLTDSIKATFDGIVDSGVKGVDASVRAVKVEDDVPRENLPLSLEKDLRGIEEVGQVYPGYQGSAVLVDREGTAVRNSMAPTIGLAYWPDDIALTMVRGRGPQGPGEIVVEKSTLKRSGLAVGDTAQVLVQGEPRKAKIVGEMDFDAALAGATLVLFDGPTAQKAFSPDGTVQGFSLRGKAGTSPEQLRDRVAQVLPAEAEVLTSAQLQQEAEEDMDSKLGYVSTFLLVFAAIGLFVGSFLIANTFSMLVARRVRELALLRAVGASRGQVLRVVLGEALVIGAVGAGLGVLVGLGIASGALAFLADQSGSPVGTGTPLQGRTVAISLLVGIVVTMMSALVPALRASRISPVDALRDDIVMTPKGARIRGTIGIVLSVLGSAALAGEVTASSPAWSLIGVYALAVVSGSLLAAPLSARPVIHVVCWPFVVFSGVVGRLARQNALRNPRRTASTASALMIGLALIAGVGVIAESMKASVADIVEDELTSDFVLSAGNEPIAPSVASRAEKLDGVGSVVAMGQVPLAFQGEWATGLTGDSRALGESIRLPMVSGELSALERGQVLVPEEMAKAHSWTVGSTFEAAVGSSRGHRLTVGGVFEDSQVLGQSLLVPRPLYEKGVPLGEQGDFYIFVKASAGADLEKVRSELKGLVKQYIVVSVQDSQEYTQSMADDVDQLLLTLYALLFLSVVIAVLGIFNTLALSVFERTREIGLLRAVGLGRWQLSRVVTIEAVATAVFGAVLGSLVGLGLGIAVQQALVSEGLDILSIPWMTIGVLVGFSGVVGVLAAVFPTVRAVRLDVLKAISTE